MKSSYELDATIPSLFVCLLFHLYIADGHSLLVLNKNHLMHQKNQYKTIYKKNK